MAITHCSKPLQKLACGLCCAALLALATGARANCMICDEIVTLDSARAACFMQNFDEINTKIALAPHGRMSFDLDACTVEGETLNRRGGIATLPRINDGGATPAPAKSVYLLDKRLVACLRDLIENHPEPLDPSAVFDLFEDCPE